MDDEMHPEEDGVNLGSVDEDNDEYGDDENSDVFSSQNPAKIRRIFRNLLSPLSKNRTKAYKEASREIYAQICSILGVSSEGLSKKNLHNRLIHKVFHRARCMF